MIKYCKAYKIKDLRNFSEWAEPEPKEGNELSDDDIAFVWENLTMTKSCFDEMDYLLEEITPEWQDFCMNELKFGLPEDLQDAK